MSRASAPIMLWVVDFGFTRAVGADSVYEGASNTTRCCSDMFLSTIITTSLFLIVHTGVGYVPCPANSEGGSKPEGERVSTNLVLLPINSTTNFVSVRPSYLLSLVFHCPCGKEYAGRMVSTCRKLADPLRAPLLLDCLPLGQCIGMLAYGEAN
jgi:hypothetical protein